ncbi:MAG: alpha-N-acetylglucosaminidase TIM-barrel domain-containing protein [Clostridium sp.]
MSKKEIEYIVIENKNRSHIRTLKIKFNAVYNIENIYGDSIKFIKNIYISEDDRTYIKVKENETFKASSLKLILFKEIKSNELDLNFDGEFIKKERKEENNIGIESYNRSIYSKLDEKTKKLSEKNEVDISVFQNLVERILGKEYIDYFIFNINNEELDNYFKINKLENKVEIIGDTRNSLAAGFNEYIRKYLNIIYDPLNESTYPDEIKIVYPDKSVEKKASLEHRYILNYCTFSYTMPYWGWKEYEEFLDYCALNGINKMLNIVGLECIFRRTWMKFGYNKEEANKIFTGPSYVAWQYMGNMNSFGSELPENWDISRVELARKINTRMLELGIEPILNGYSGMVPPDFKEKQFNAHILEQGSWCKFKRPNMLNMDSDDENLLFDEVAKVYYDSMKFVYGDVSKYLATDPFHEGGKTEGIDLVRAAKKINQAMKFYNNNAIWVLQAWQKNPKNEILKGTDKENTLILDLFGDVNPEWIQTEEFLGRPWIFNILNNFGGRMGLTGSPSRIKNQFRKAINEGKSLSGIGITAESLGTNPVIYQMVLDMVWQDENDIELWMNEYYKRRYKIDNIDEYVTNLLETVYRHREDYFQGAPESIINARPRFGLSSASTWGSLQLPYDMEQFEKMVIEFINSINESSITLNLALEFDVIALISQVISNKALKIYTQLEEAYQEKDINMFKLLKGLLIKIIEIQEVILNNNNKYKLKTWTNQARNMIEGIDDWTKDSFMYESKALITTWGDKIAADNGGLRDYSNRQWAGLVGSLYLKRWSIWLDMVESEFYTDKLTDIDWYEIEYKWILDELNELEIDRKKYRKVMKDIQKIEKDIPKIIYKNSNQIEEVLSIKCNEIGISDNIRELTQNGGKVKWNIKRVGSLIFEIELIEPIKIEKLNIMFKEMNGSVNEVTNLGYKLEGNYDKEYKLIVNRINDYSKKQECESIYCGVIYKKLRITFSSLGKEIELNNIRGIQILGKSCK